jgi:hypothetical protein
VQKSYRSNTRRNTWPTHLQEYPIKPLNVGFFARIKKTHLQQFPIPPLNLCVLGKIDRSRLPCTYPWANKGGRAWKGIKSRKGFMMKM